MARSRNQKIAEELCANLNSRLNHNPHAFNTNKTDIYYPGFDAFTFGVVVGRSPRKASNFIYHFISSFYKPLPCVGLGLSKRLWKVGVAEEDFYGPIDVVVQDAMNALEAAGALQTLSPEATYDAIETIISPENPFRPGKLSCSVIRGIVAALRDDWPRALECFAEMRSCFAAYLHPTYDPESYATDAALVDRYTRAAAEGPAHFRDWVTGYMQENGAKLGFLGSRHWPPAVSPAAAPRTPGRPRRT